MALGPARDMLRDLIVREILLVEHLDLEFQSGLNVLTGETGAGKSILLDCLGFVLGRRGRADLTRAGADTGEVTATFQISQDSPVHDVLEEAGIKVEDELILRRLSSGGRKKAFINDKLVSADIMRSVGQHLIEIHGQHDDKGLLDPRSHISYLDTFGGLEAQLDGVGAKWKALREAEKALASAQEALENAERDREYLSHAVGEFEALAPEAGEDGKLDAERRLLRAAERIRGEVVKAREAMGGPDGAQGRILDAMRWLTDVSESAEGGLDGAIAALDRGLNEMADAEGEVDRMLTVLTADPSKLEAVEERLFAIRGLARKHNVHVDELPDLAADLAARYDAIASGGTHIDKLRADFDKQRDAYRLAAEKLTTSRKRAAAKLDKAMTAELAPLKMDRAVFTTLIEPADPGPRGMDSVGFQVATNPGAPAGPIASIASGGELSRFLLALKVCLKGDGQHAMIFDEIDRGIGGATADAVGRRLSTLADAGQVIVVTHSPQVAALADHHWRVSKRSKGAKTWTDVTPLDTTERVDEVARMLAGELVTDEAKEAAKALLAG